MENVVFGGCWVSIGDVAGDRGVVEPFTCPRGPPSRTSPAPRLSCQLCSPARGARQLTHGSDDSDHEVLAGIKGGSDLLAEVRVGDLDIVLGVSVRVHEVQEALQISARIRRNTIDANTHVVNGKKLVLGTADIGDLHVVGGGRDILELLAGENLECQL